jgi:GNAT superfamily N-acetyltransferase
MQRTLADMTDFTVSELSIPSNIASGDAADFIEATAVSNDIAADILGNRDLDREPAELLPEWQNQKYEPKRLFVARTNGRIVARATHELGDSPASKTAWLSVEVLREFRGRGIGAALFDRLLEVSDELGKTVLQSYAMSRADQVGERLLAPTGFGSVPLDDPATGFLLHRGFRLEQVERMSRLALPIEPTALLGYLSEAHAAAGADYRALHWNGITPNRWLDDIATLHQRMSTDAPFAGLDIDEEAWDADRARATDQLIASSPSTRLMVAALHIPSGRLAGFNELVVSAEQHRSVEQRDTLVLSEHRGRRLGMLMKAANLFWLQDLAPGHPSVTTYNAEENRHMLSVNETMGFVAYGYEGLWQRAQ